MDLVPVDLMELWGDRPATVEDWEGETEIEGEEEEEPVVEDTELLGKLEAR